jgi:hypothetical protein
MIKLRYSKRLFKRSSSSSKQQASAFGAGTGDTAGVGGARGEIQWEMRTGGMLVQKREGRCGEEVIVVRVATGFSWHDVSIRATSTFGQRPALLYCLSLSLMVDSECVLSCSKVD